LGLQLLKIFILCTFDAHIHRETKVPINLNMKKIQMKNYSQKKINGQLKAKKMGINKDILGSMV